VRMDARYLENAGAVFNGVRMDLVDYF